MHSSLKLTMPDINMKLMSDINNAINRILRKKFQQDLAIEFYENNFKTNTIYNQIYNWKMDWVLRQVHRNTPIKFTIILQ